MKEIFDGWALGRLEPLAWAVGAVVGALVLGLLIHAVLFKVIRRFARRTETTLDDAIVKHCLGPSRLMFPVAALDFAIPVMRLSAEATQDLRHAASLGLIAGVAWLMTRLTQVASDVLQHRYNLAVPDNLRARKVQTQLRVLRGVVTVIVVVIASASMLMTFEKVRQLGTSILASAGIVGIVAGMAAQRTLSNLFAGVQLAITQPIRIDDVVIVEGEWGRIEEITFTYVIVRIWDLRRLVVPISYFIEKPFQNWTRVTADILGTVFFQVDYCVPLQALREELQRLLQASDNWDGKVWGIQVTDASERTMQVRALMSSADASKSWDLRCHVREKLLEFIQQNYPQALPRLRAELGGPVVGQQPSPLTAVGATGPRA